MNILFFILFSPSLIDFIFIEGAQIKSNIENWPLGVSKNSRKRTKDSNVDSNKGYDILKSKKPCNISSLYDEHNGSKESTDLNPCVPKEEFLLHFYDNNSTQTKDDKLDNNNKKIDIYKVPTYFFDFRVNSLVKVNNSNATIICQINISENLSISRLIDWFTSVFCEVRFNKKDDAFKIKKDFRYLVLAVPEFLPFIYFINKRTESFRPNLETLEFKLSFMKFYISFYDWIRKYYEIFEGDFLATNINTVDITKFFGELNEDQKTKFYSFRKLLVDFLQILKADENLIENYKHQILFYEFKVTQTSRYFSLAINFFIYFINNCGPESKNYQERYNKYKYVIDKVTSVKKLDDRFIDKSIDLKIFKSSINEYTLMMDSLGMPEFNLQNYLEGFTNFDKTSFEQKYLQHDYQNDEWQKKAYFFTIWKLLYLNFLKHFINE